MYVVSLRFDFSRWSKAKGQLLMPVEPPWKGRASLTYGEEDSDVLKVLDALCPCSAFHCLLTALVCIAVADKATPKHVHQRPREILDDNADGHVSVSHSIVIALSQR